MPIFQFISSISLDYRGSPLAHVVADLTDADGLELLFGGPRYTTGFVNQSQPFQLIGISPAGQLSNLSSGLPAGGAVHARELVVADFNRDGRADAFSANHGYDGGGFPGEQDDLFLSSGGGLTAGATPALSDFAHSAAVGDVDGDGDIDIFVGNFGGLGDSHSGPYVLRNNGAGGFEVAASGFSAQALDGLTSSALLDVDGDGDVDLVGGNHGGTGSAGWVWLNNGAGVFANDPARALPEGTFGRSITLDVAAMDFDRDGDLDLILSQTRYEPFYSGSSLQFLENDGAGGYTDVTAERMAVQDSTAAWADTVYVADLNGDGYDDLVVSRPGGGGSAGIALNDGAGRFRYVDGDTLGLSGRYWTPLDYNGDGLIDIVSFDRDIPTEDALVVSLHRNTGFTTLAVTEAADEVLGSTGGDTAIAGAGDDLMMGAGGSDYLRGGEGSDWIAGGDEFDDVHGNMGDDTVTGGGGGDWVVGGKNNDLLFGDEGGDVSLGNMGNDTVDGGTGDDVVRGGKDDDVVMAGAGNDWVSGDRGTDVLTGGGGADNFHVFDGSGVDRVTDFSVAEGDRVWLLAGTEWSAAQVGADTVVTVTGAEGGQLVLTGVTLSGLPEGWIFGT